MSRSLYCRNEDKFFDYGCYDFFLVIKLINNYRLYLVVFKLFFVVFYYDELKFCVEVRMRESLCQWEKFLSKGFLVIFYGFKVKLYIFWLNFIFRRQLVKIFVRFIGFVDG